MAYQYPGMSAYVENALQMAGPSYDPAAVLRSLGQLGLQKKAYKEQKEENKSRWERGFARQSELDKLNEELARARQKLSEAADVRAETTSEMNRIGSFYPYATTEARKGTRQELIDRGLIPESLLKETMVDYEGYSPHPAAQADLYPSTSDLRTTPRIVNAPEGTPLNLGYSDVAYALENLRRMRRENRTDNRRTPNPLLPYGLRNPINIRRMASFR